MQITDIEVARYELPLDPPFHAAWDPDPRRSLPATVLRVRTDAGLTGVASGDTVGDLERHRGHFVGTDPLRLEQQVRRIASIGFHGGRYWPVEAACWDIAGQVAGLPVATLLGGAVDRVPAYASWGSLLPPGQRAEDAARLVAEGWRAVKVRVHPARIDEGVAVVRAVRETVGATLDVMVDLNQAWRMAGDTTAPMDLTLARRTVRRLAELDVFWVEEPLPYADVDGLRLLRADNPGTRIAAGEMLDDLPATIRLLEADALDVHQADAMLALGISRARTVAELAHLKHRAFTPHTWGNGLGLLANLHLAAGVGAGPYLEVPHDPAGGWTAERRDFLLAEPLRPGPDGCLAVPDRPGLGAVLHPDVERWRQN